DVTAGMSDLRLQRIDRTDHDLTGRHTGNGQRLYPTGIGRTRRCTGNWRGWTAGTGGRTSAGASVHLGTTTVAGRVARGLATLTSTAATTTRQQQHRHDGGETQTCTRTLSTLAH